MGMTAGMWLHYLFCFLGAVFVTNAIPHFVSGCAAGRSRVHSPARRARASPPRLKT
ncbi:hypothetical protein [Novosphingobium album (ex Hu et al. 2023)]|uniref:Uncharacterized protein n=1 Tax=Novosphingobium album (ex Hu et al. 2023) TaxID=2930093 RepID=A0ABT0AXV2_9SPHN|nr:hypothetical protein [Novosphingobium album (ex Hu et al. 2023)]MCJ2177634.1 hypothetical protein [Novosphingobium album (ex Hu et al. 2023)]